MNILVISDYFYPKIGGITEHVYNQVKFLRKNGHNVKLLTPYPLFISRKKLRDMDNRLLGVGTVIRLGFAIPVFANDSVAQVGVVFSFKKKITKLIKEHSINIIHIHSPLFSYYGLSTIKHTSKIPIVGTFHTYFKKSFLFEYFNKLLSKYFKAIDIKIPVSKSADDILYKFFGKRGTVINNGIDLEYYNTERYIDRFNDGKLNVFFIGRPEPRNGIDILIKAFVLVKRNFDNIRLIIAGNKNGMEVYQNLAKKTPCSSDIHFVGAINEERPAYYHTADIHVFPVEIAAFSVTVLEGMAAAKPVITTDMSGMREIIGSEDNAILTKYGDYETIAKEILRLALDEELRERYGKNARNRVKAFSWEIVVKKLEVKYREVLGNAP